MKKIFVLVAVILSSSFAFAAQAAPSSCAELRKLVLQTAIDGLDKQVQLASDQPRILATYKLTMKGFDAVDRENEYAASLQQTSDTIVQAVTAERAALVEKALTRAECFK